VYGDRSGVQNVIDSIFDPSVISLRKWTDYDEELKMKGEVPNNGAFGQIDGLMGWMHIRPSVEVPRSASMDMPQSMPLMYPPPPVMAMTHKNGSSDSSELIIPHKYGDIPEDDELERAVTEYLASVNLEQATKRSVREHVENLFGFTCDLPTRKKLYAMIEKRLYL
jgi:DEK C terminal domain